jgi:monovalent cation:H+ antiporter-2, CPA2 family
VLNGTVSRYANMEFVLAPAATLDDGPDVQLLNEILIALLAAILFVPVAQRLGLSAVLGYLFAGLAVGPRALGLVHDTATAATLAEFGVVFLLFAIGLELPLGRVAALRRYMFGLGLAQVVLTGLILAAVASAGGMKLAAAAVVGLALALSSTATVLQLLGERGEMTSRFGRVSVSVLLFQDLAAVPLLAALPLLAGEEEALPMALALALVKTAVAVAVIVAAGRLVVRPALQVIAAARSRQVFVAAGLFLALGTGWASAQAGLSMALGAFLAGMLLADTEFRHQMESDIAPFRDLFLGVFFMTVGMAIDLRQVAADAGTIAALTLLLLAAKAAVIFGLALAFGLGRAIAARTGLLLAQGGEFAFIVFGLAAEQRLFSAAQGQRLAAVVAVSMALTPALAALAQFIGRRLETHEGLKTAGPGEDDSLRGHIVIAGFGRVGQTIGRLLAARNLRYVAVDEDMGQVTAGRRAGLPLFYGDASRIDLLGAVGIAHASAVVVTMNDAAKAERTVAALRRHFPDLPIIARARDGAHARRLHAVGASTALAETVEASLQLGAAALQRAGVPAAEVEAVLDEHRGDDYAKLADIGQPAAEPRSPV